MSDQTTPTSDPSDFGQLLNSLSPDDPLCITPTIATIICHHTSSRVAHHGTKIERLSPTEVVVVRHRICNSCGLHFWTLEASMAEEDHDQHHVELISRYLTLLIGRAVCSGVTPKCWPWSYSLKSARDHLTTQLPPKKTWRDVIQGRVVVTHLKPLTAFNYPEPGEPLFDEAWALSNLTLKSV